MYCHKRHSRESREEQPGLMLCSMAVGTIIAHPDLCAEKNFPKIVRFEQAYRKCLNIILADSMA